MWFLEQCKGVLCVDVGESFQTHIYLQNFVSIQPRTSPVKFAASPGLRAPLHSPSWPPSGTSSACRRPGSNDFMGFRGKVFFKPGSPQSVKIGRFSKVIQPPPTPVRQNSQNTIENSPKFRADRKFNRVQQFLKVHEIPTNVHQHRSEEQRIWHSKCNFCEHLI